MQDVELTIAANGVRFPADGTVEDRLRAAMRDVRDPIREHDIFFMSGRLNDDLRLRAAIAAVMLKASDDEKDRITRSLKPLQMLAAATQGIPVDFGAFAMDDDLLPLMGMWHETAPQP